MLSQLSFTQRRLAQAQERVGSGLRISRPSDDPFSVSRIMASRTALERSRQYERSATMAISVMGATEAALTRLTALLQRASELSIQAASGSMSASGRTSIALEISQLLDEAIATGNTSHAGSYLFAGQMTDTAPYVPDIPANPTSVTYAGDTALIQREISAGTRIAVNITGDRVMPPLFATLIQLRDDLNANDASAVDASAGAVVSRLDEVLGLRSEIGAAMRRVELTQTRLQDDEIRLRTLMAELEQADLAETIVELQMQENAYQAALGAAGRTLSLTLLDFLR